MQIHNQTSFPEKNGIAHKKRVARSVLPTARAMPLTATCAAKMTLPVGTKKNIDLQKNASLSLQHGMRPRASDLWLVDMQCTLTKKQKQSYRPHKKKRVSKKT
jgi:hypothetical protein